MTNFKKTDSDPFVHGGSHNFQALLVNDLPVAVNGSAMAATTLTADSVQLNGGTGTQGTLSWNDIEETLDLICNGATLQIGQEQYWGIKNDTGGDIDNGEVVYATGYDAVSEKITVDKYLADGSIPAKFVLGITTSDILDGESGKATTFGKVRDVDTSSFVAPAVLYCSDTVPGGLQDTPPIVPSLELPVAQVLVSHASAGVLATRVENTNAAKQLTQVTYGLNDLGVSGTNYIAGFYDFPAAAANLTNGAPSISWGTTGNGYAAHAFIVFGAASVDTGVVGLRCTGTTIQDDGTITNSDTHVLSSDITSLTLDDYLEGVKFMGPVVFELFVVSGTPVVYSCDFNYGYAKYSDTGNTDFVLDSLNIQLLAKANDTGFDLELIEHGTTGYTYSAGAFDPVHNKILNVRDEYFDGTTYFSDLKSGDPFVFKRNGIGALINGTGAAGYIIRVTTATNASIRYGNVYVGVKPQV